MPELPEVETVVRSLQPRLVGRRIMAASFSSRLVVRQNFDELSEKLRGQRVNSVNRRGKFILVELDRGFLVIHLGMTGKLLFDAAAGKHARAIFELDEGVLVYDDSRHFGRIEWNETLPARVGALGPDALTIPVEDFRSLLRGRTTRVKALLLNQRILAGMGNIYTDEALFIARIHPKTMAARLSKAKVNSLHAAMVSILSLAIRHKGSSISNYVDADGKRGAFQLQHQVYGREGKACNVCGTAIRRIVVAQRGTHYCPRCQKT